MGNTSSNKITEPVNKTDKVKLQTCVTNLENNAILLGKLGENNIKLSEELRKKNALVSRMYTDMRTKQCDKICEQQVKTAKKECIDSLKNNTPINQSAGYDDIYYMEKYLKYKTKYLQLKHNKF